MTPLAGYVYPWVGILVGGLGGLLYLAVEAFELKVLKIDDPLKYFCSHLLVLALFMQLQGPGDSLVLAYLQSKPSLISCMILNFLVTMDCSMVAVANCWGSIF